MLLYKVSFFIVTVNVDDLHSLFAVQINRIEYQDNVTVSRAWYGMVRKFRY